MTEGAVRDFTVLERDCAVVAVGGGGTPGLRILVAVAGLDGASASPDAVAESGLRILVTVARWDGASALPDAVASS